MRVIHSKTWAALLTTGMVANFTLASHCVAETSTTFTERYDRFNGYTALKLDFGEVVKGSSHDVKLTFTCLFDGEGRKSKKGQPRLCFYCYSTDGWVYLDYHAVRLLVDGMRMAFDPDHDGKVETGYVLERMYLDADTAQTREILRADKVEGRIGRDEFALDRDQIAAIKEFAALIEDPDRPVPTGVFSAPAKPKTPEEAARAQEEKRREDSRLQEELKRQKMQLLDAKLNQQMKLGKALEKRNLKAALQYYAEVVKLAPDSSQAKAAKERIAALTPK